MAAEYDRDPGGYGSGARQLPKANAKIYAHSAVRASLRAAQADKCAFCEALVTHITPGDVEHYRPKRGYKQRRGDPLTAPGYYWLAYDWDNLFLVCPLCNQRFKENLFPLRVQRDRARCHHDDHTRERPLLVHPVRDSPARHIGFRDEVPVPRTKRGAATIALLGLDRKELSDRRAERRRAILILRQFRDRLAAELERVPADGGRAELTAIEQQLADAVSDAGEYAAMVRAM